MSALPLQGQVTLNTIGLERARPGIASSQLFTKPQDSPFPQQGLQDPGVPAGNRGAGIWSLWESLCQQLVIPCHYPTGLSWATPSGPRFPHL